jgi:hypothetical protein
MASTAYEEDGGFVDLKWTSVPKAEVLWQLSLEQSAIATDGRLYYSSGGLVTGPASAATQELGRVGYEQLHAPLGEGTGAAPTDPIAGTGTTGPVTTTNATNADTGSHESRGCQLGATRSSGAWWRRGPAPHILEIQRARGRSLREVVAQDDVVGAACVSAATISPAIVVVGGIDGFA